MRILIALFVCIACVACNSPTTPDKSITLQDSTQVTEIPIENKATFDIRSFKTLVLPIRIDSSFISSIDSSKRISYLQLRSLNARLLSLSEENSLSHHIESFCQIDSIKSAGTYEAYLSNLDIGMMKNSIAFQLGQFEFEGQGNLFLWGISYGSFEACPSSSGYVVIATFTNKEQKNFHFLIGERSWWADPPATVSDEVNSLLSEKGMITVEKKRIQDDIDLPGMNIDELNYEISFTNGEPVLKELKRESSVNEKEVP